MCKLKTVVTAGSEQGAYSDRRAAPWVKICNLAASARHVPRVQNGESTVGGQRGVRCVEQCRSVIVRYIITL